MFTVKGIFCPVNAKIVISCIIGPLTCLALTGCRPKPQDGKDLNNPETSETHQSTPLFEGWENPSAVFVFSGDESGYLEPCGCSERQSGGFARRADLIRQIEDERSWPVTAFDVGGILDLDRITYPQSKIKFLRMLDGFNRMGYQGLALGREELLLGPAAIFEAHTQLTSNEDFDVPFMASNVTFYGTKDLGTPISSRIVEVGNKRIGVIAIVGETTRKKLDETGVTRDENELKIDAVDESLRAALDGLKEEQPNLIILLSHSEIDESIRIAEQFPEIPIIVTAGGAEDPRLEPTMVGETMVVEVGRKGKNVAVVALMGDGNLKHEIVELDMDRFDLDPRMTELMRDYQNDLEAAYDQLISDDLAVSHSRSSTFMGAETCKECHKGAYEVWNKSRHSHALDSLVEGRESYGDAWVSRIHDPECLTCHTTGWDQQAALRFRSGFASLEKTPHLAGNQCENCHGPASEHVELEKSILAGASLTPELTADRNASMQELRLSLAEAKKNVCIKCHDHDNSPNFNFETYWPKVNHSGLRN
ncbi:Perchlorate reductase subunit gamma precursor [Thalassoglobus neptunius]|uniref:Perchlorate reductase subunit gamma n=1 Tax=Thalassoglobus neptunius TaxID=1938619 RepID=A0A5C5X321_9PLAN|nr:multiheme c-type cytochrome [Thalassoglobus neptunius]TWT57477.1 Perchlorate reductase subunit gamma precursor [Thalassoglobus neptunius]